MLNLIVFVVVIVLFGFTFHEIGYKRGMTDQINRSKKIIDEYKQNSDSINKEMENSYNKLLSNIQESYDKLQKNHKKDLLDIHLAWEKEYNMLVSYLKKSGTEIVYGSKPNNMN